jgi:Cu+-exporting ATPase
VSVDLKARALARWEGEGGTVLAEAAHSLKDLACGIAVTEQSTHRHEHEGRAYFSCSDHCKTKFAAEPLKYVPVAAAPSQVAGVVYGCPMHPEIRRDQPGSCPKCEMALEPEPR